MPNPSYHLSAVGPDFQLHSENPWCWAVPQIYSKQNIFLGGEELQFSSTTPSCWTLCDPMDCSTPGLPVHHQLLELAQTHVRDTIQPSHPLEMEFSCRLCPPATPSLQETETGMKRRYDTNKGLFGEVFGWLVVPGLSCLSMQGLQLQHVESSSLGRNRTPGIGSAES